MLVSSFPAGAWGTNCYLVANGPNSECLIIDPGMDAVDGVRSAVDRYGLRPVAVLLTHGHVDHMWSVVPVADGYGIPAMVHPSDRHLLTDPAAAISPQAREVIAQMIGDEPLVEPEDVIEFTGSDVINLAGMQWRVDHAPGHTQGSVTFSAARGEGDPPVLVSGDVLFAGSIGRTDLPGGDMTEMMRSLTRVVLPLDDDTVVLPGHGESTTIGRERATNPFLLGLLGEGVPPEQRRGL